jgi:hypothetical protein
MNSRNRMIFASAALVVALLLATGVQATLVGVLEQISPTPTLYIQGATATDPAPPGNDFSTLEDSLFTARGEATADVQYIPGLGDDPQDFIDAGFLAGNIALIERGAVQFDLKITNAEGAGASGVLIANTTPSSSGGVFEGGITVQTTIPALMLRYDLGQDFITSLGGGGTLNMHLSVSNPPPPPPGNWNGRIIAIDDQNDATDTEINSATEALAILDYADGGANTGGWNLRYDVSDTRNLVDMAGGGGTFPVNNPYPNGESVPDNSPTPGDDFLVTAETSLPFNIPAGDWTIGFGSDDGGALRIPGIVFSNEINTDGDPGLDDTILFDAPRGHVWTTGEFTVGPGGMVAAIEALMYERGGGDSFEIAISQGHNGNAVADDGSWLLLQDGAFGITVVPEPSTLILCGLGLIGLLAIGRRR